MRRIVINTSPWIALSICEQTNILEKLYDEVYMPSAVKQEILAGRKRVGVKELNESHWLKIENIISSEKVEFLYELGRGEAEVITLAKEKGINLVLIDEKVARMQAKILNSK